MISNTNQITFLSPREILDFSVLAEEKSHRLYDSISKAVHIPEMKEIFGTFAQEELKHRDLFRKMIYEGSQNVYDDKSLPEHIAYLQSMINATIFSKDLLAEKIKRMKSIESSFEFLISVELDQILLYSEIKEFLLERHKPLIDTIIGEERRHFVRIMKYKQMKNY